MLQPYDMVKYVKTSYTKFAFFWKMDRHNIIYFLQKNKTPKLWAKFSWFSLVKYALSCILT